jgi:hypothetical protein
VGGMEWAGGRITRVRPRRWEDPGTRYTLAFVLRQETIGGFGNQTEKTKFCLPSVDQ